jgi:hypothetical protein
MAAFQGCSKQDSELRIDRGREVAAAWILAAALFAALALGRGLPTDAVALAGDINGGLATLETAAAPRSPTPALTAALPAVARHPVGDPHG